MRLSARTLAPVVASVALALFAGAFAQAQSTASPTAGNGTYVPTDPLSQVRYDNRFDVSVGLAYGHIKAGPPPLHEGANLGGLDVSGAYWVSKHWGVEGTGRAYLGTSGAGVNSVNVRGPFVAEYIFAGGPVWLGPHNKHAALIAHALAGGAYGNFQSGLQGNPPSLFSFFQDQVAMAGVFGGHIDLNRTPRWVFRITSDALYTRYAINYGSLATYPQWNYAISVGADYKFKKKR